MTAKIEPRSGIFYGWGKGANDWDLDMDENLTRIGRVLTHLTVLSASISDPPADANDGDAYIVAESPTGEWQGQEGKLAIATTDGMSNWIFYTPQIGWLCYQMDTDKLAIFKAGGWGQVNI